MLVVSEVCAWGYGAGRARDGRPRGVERLVGRSAARAAVGFITKPDGGNRSTSQTSYRWMLRQKA